MSKLIEKKRRKDAVSYTFMFFGCKDVMMNVDGKVYVYEPVLMRLAKTVSNYGQPTFSLYRDLHRAVSARDIHGVRAICVEDFNKENFLCKISISEAEGANVLYMEESLK